MLIVQSLISFLGKGDVFPLLLSDNILLLVLLIPLFSIFLIFLISMLGNEKIYQFSLLSSAFSFLLSLFLWYSFEEVKGGFQFSYNLIVIPSLSIGLRLGVDGISIFFILLTNLFIYLCILSLNVTTPRLSEALLHLFFFNEVF